MQDFIEAAHEPWPDGDADEWVGAALAQLSEERRTALEAFLSLRLLLRGDLTDTQLPRNTVKTRLFHGRRKLRELLPPLATPRCGRNCSADSIGQGNAHMPQADTRGSSHH
jgi:hypothetical protein